MGEASHARPARYVPLCAMRRDERYGAYPLIGLCSGEPVTRMMGSTGGRGLRFVLVQGVYHSLWCWDRLIPELDRRDHEAVTVDVPIGDQAAGASEYGDVIAEAVEDRNTIVVRHSMDDLAISLASSRGYGSGAGYGICSAWVAQ